MRNASKVFLVADDPLLAALTRATLGRSGEYEVLEEHSERHALIALFAFRPDLVLLDLDSAWIDGGTTAARIRGEAALSGIPLVLISASAQTADALHPGENWLPRSFKPLDLLVLCHDVLHTKQMPDFAAATQAGARAHHILHAHFQSDAA